MARLIAIECDSNEVRIAVGSSGLTGVSLEHVASSPVALDSNEEILNSVKTFEAIQSLLKQLAVRSGNVIFCIGRSSIELRSLTLPTVDKNELPDMVRFAAQRQFANAGDSWPIDYVVMPSSQEGMTDCLAATINPATVDRINKIVLSLGLTLTQIVLRPMASATMAIIKQPQLANSAVLLMELYGDEADMAVMDQGNVVFMRNVRFSNPAEAESNSFALLGEIRRTLIAAASQRSNLNIQQVRIWGSGPQHADLCETLSLALESNVESLDPLDLFEASKTVRLVAGDNTGKFASAIGALLAPQVSDRLIDFSNPRKREEKKKPVVKYALAGAAAVLALGGAYAWNWMSHSALNSEIAGLEEAIAKNAKSIELSTKKLADWNKVENFLQGDHNWLDELEYMSTHAAPADKTIFSVTTFMTDAKTNSASVSTKFVAKKQEDIPEYQESFRDPQHSVLSTSVIKSQDKTGDFPWIADLNMQLAPVKVSDPRTQKKPKMASNPANATPSANKPAVDVQGTPVDPKAAPPVPSETESPPKTPAASKDQETASPPATSVTPAVTPSSTTTTEPQTTGAGA
ncbi:MAG: hypothetical protein NTU79_16365 [Planctomycetota bacterium]|nr:hypothetical protein [Planctomycetota bacterium]